MPDVGRSGRRKQERYALSGLFLPPRASLPIAVHNLFKKMVVFLIVFQRRFLTTAAKLLTRYKYRVRQTTPPKTVINRSLGTIRNTTIFLNRF